MILLSLFFLIICSFTDLRERGISVMLLAAFLTSSILLMLGVHISGTEYVSGIRLLLYDPGPLSIAAAFIPGVVLLMVSLFTGEAIGRGDVYMIGVLGFMQGLERTVIILFFSMVMTAVFGAACIVTGKGNRKSTLPYAPFLLTAYVLMTVSGSLRRMI
ncbi:MAG: prepilin peptidase [Lachnospiraceae bacterium]|nr:prepilin peptidase [Lachnospiraceae bacterium]